MFYYRIGTETRTQAFPGSGSLGQFHKVRGLGCLATHGLHLQNPLHPSHSLLSTGGNISEKYQSVEDCVHIPSIRKVSALRPRSLAGVRLGTGQAGIERQSEATCGAART